MPHQMLTTLSFEIITAILNELEWSDLLNVRKACKALNDASRIHGVWINQYHRYAMQKTLRPRLEEPLDSYSAEGLERWVLTRRSADFGWISDSSEPTRKRWIRYKSPSAMYLVQGGRWLLVGGDDGSVMAYDLDATETPGTVMIPPRDAADPQPVDWIAIEIDETVPKLTFTLTVSPRLPQMCAGIPSLKIQIWRVTLCGHASEAHLTAYLLTSFSANEEAKVRSICLRGRLFARSMSTIFRHQSYIEVFDWIESISHMHRKATILTEDVTGCLHILPDHRLLAISISLLLVFEISNLVDVAPVATSFPQTSTVPQWAVPYEALQTCRSNCLPSISGKQASYFVVHSGYAIHGFIVPHAFDQPPRLTELMQMPNRAVYSFVGFEKAVVAYTESSTSVTALRYSWDVGLATGTSSQSTDMSPASSGSRYLLQPWHDTFVVMDEETGRMAVRFRNDILVIDTALCYSSRSK